MRGGLIWAVGTRARGSSIGETEGSIPNSSLKGRDTQKPEKDGRRRLRQTKKKKKKKKKKKNNHARVEIKTKAPQACGDSHEE